MVSKSGSNKFLKNIIYQTDHNLVESGIKRIKRRLLRLLLIFTSKVILMILIYKMLLFLQKALVARNILNLPINQQQKQVLRQWLMLLEMT